MRNIRAFFIAFFITIVAGIGACASNHASDSNAQYGVVKSINPTTETSSGVNVGTLIGGVVGGLAGHQVGSGRGNTAATVAGAVGGAVIGTDVGNRSKGQMYKIGVRMNDGQFVTVNQKGSVANLRVGERVALQDGEVHPA
ncbi:MAG TPA: glycine zipper 2TM domain-containing protein [Gammaproteobacteria bacterium]|nr:glycine zipper 2TM domain-containing protein [Gammaproteobacteria bacterium]